MADFPDQDQDQGITAYHGSPHEFDQFDISKIGTGEGAQAYGHGLYFAEDERVARSYRDALTPGRGFEPEDTAARLLDAHGGNQKAASAEMLRRIDDAKARGISNDQVMRLVQAHDIITTQPAKATGRMYEVRINAHPDHFLDWDKPLDQQPYVMNKLIEASAVHPNGDLTFMYRETPRHGGEMYERLTSPLSKKVTGGEGQKSASDFLHSIGIKGIKYFDQGSRGAGEGSRNYVVFDDKLVTTKRRYERGGAVYGNMDMHPGHGM
jgi:hypothetical protein